MLSSMRVVPPGTRVAFFGTNHLHLLDFLHCFVANAVVSTVSMMKEEVKLSCVSCRVLRDAF